MATGKRTWKQERRRPVHTNYVNSGKERLPSEPYMEFLHRMCEEVKLLTPKLLVLDLGLLDIPHSEVCRGFEIQYAVAVKKADKKWIDEVRLEAQSICPDSFIDQSLPSLTGRKLTTKKKVNVSIWEPSTGMCKDVRL